MRYHLQLLGMVLAVSLCLPLPVFAVKAHTQGCNNCHRYAANPRSMANVCTSCHERDVDPLGRFTSAKASDALESHPNHLSPALITGDPGDQTSHFWGGSSSLKSAAGSTYPLTTFYTSRYSISTKRVTCTICHDPHKQLGTQLVRATTADDLICKQCHTNWFILNDSADAIPGNDTNALLTHPVVTDYATFAAANPTNYNPTPSNSSNGGSGEVRLVNGGVSCTSCHGVHFTDSDSATIDGRAAANNNTLAEGDGHLLRADGPGKADKSALCQSCHTYQEHGKVGNDAFGSGVGDVQIGCLVCHSGHSFDATAPNYFVLRKTVDSGVAGFGSTATLYTTYPTSWATYCISCHGAVTGYTLRAHSLPADNDCTICHAHNAAAYSFAQGSSGSACSSCHGAPPRINTAADRVDNTNPDTGYAVGSNGTNYLTDNSGQSWKDESQTPHKRHAGALNTDKAPVDYAFGSGTILSACLPCHNDKEDAVSPVSPTHDTANSNLSFQDVHFNDFAKYNGVLTASLYKKTNPNQWMCSGIYCHSNGGKRPTTGAAKALADFKTATTPAWLDGSTTNKIVGDVDECQQCHGEDRTSMGSGLKNNSATHDKHLLKLGDGKTKCYLCHSATVDSSGTIPAAARDHRFSGTHVNGTPNVVFSPTAFGGDLATGTYASGATQGTCVVYCHSDAIGGPPALVPDWDFPTGTIVCGSCHSTAAASLSTPHAKHLAIATVTCNDCHFTVSGDATLGTHTGHVDGDYTYNQTSCDTCHGWLIGEKTPVWYESMDNDYCLTCHTGTTVGVVKGMTAPTKEHATDRGHNRTTNYTSGNLPGNKQCTSCHLTTITNHVNATLGDATHLAAAATSCTATCHGVGGSAVGANTKGIITHVGKVCTACHDPHGDETQASNIYMIRSQSLTNYNGTVVFTNTGNEVTPLTVTNSYDEDDDGLSGATGENNADDLCATCHTFAGGSAHNNRDNTATNHNMGRDCFTSGCHKPHTESTGAFIAGASACNGCHGNPPLPGDARHTDAAIGAHEVHAQSVIHDILLPEHDATDCDNCHPGASGYTYTPTGLHGSGNLALGMAGGTTGCSSACHASNGTDGFWTDTANVLTPTLTGNGLECNACHYYAATPVAGNNLTDVHDEHFTKNKNCTDCHGDMTGDYNSGLAHVGPFTHIDSYVDLDTVDDDGALYTDRAIATQDEAGFDEGGGLRDVNRSGMTYTDNNTCSGGIGLGCHATGTPDWDLTIPANGCTQCHTDTTTTTLNPTSGLHNMSTPGVQKHDNSITGGCTACHADLSTVNASHINGTWQADQANNTESRFLTGRSGLVYNDTAGPNQGSCFDDAASGVGSLDFAVSCHRDNGVWKRLWSTDADNAGTTPGSPRCKVCHGQYVPLNTNQGGGWNEGTSHNLTDGGRASIRGETHNSRVLGDASACEDCHSFPSLANHENSSLTMNDAPAAGDTDVNDSTTSVYCAICHTATFTPMTAGTFTFTKSTAFTIERVSGGYDPIQQCNSCHGVGGSGRYWPVATDDVNPRNYRGRHEIHMARLALKVYGESVATLLTTTTQTSDVKQKNLCEYCHTAPAGFAGHALETLPAEVVIANLWNKAADTGATYASNQHGAGGADTCTGVNCHNNKLTVDNSYGWYDSVTGAGCIVCHTVGGSNDLPNNNLHPNSGLHNITPTVSGVRHDDSFSTSGTCASCHTGIVTTIVGGTHINGAATADGPANTSAERGLFTAYTEAAINSSTCAGSGVDNIANCHADGGTWNRRWSTTASASNGIDECLNCHGTFAGWRWINPAPAGTTDHSDPSAFNPNGDTMGVAAKHPDCQICHGWGKPGYDTTWHNKTVGVTPGHGDGRITMNGPDDVPGPGAGAKYDDATWGCAAACHSSTWVLSDSGLTPNYGDYGGGSCGSCHDDGAIPPNSGAHVAHGADADSDYTECEACHGTDNGGSWTAGTGGSHNTGSVNFAAGITYSNGGTPGTNAAANNDTCSTTQCHSKTPEVATWGTPASLGCDECHNATATVVANNAGRTLSNSHNTHFAKGKTCMQCHTVLANRTHISAGSGTDGVILTGRANAAQDEAIVTITDASIDGSNSCSGTTGIGVGCHNTKPTPAWGTTGIGCSNCHVPGGGAAADPASGLHAMTATNVQPHNATLRTGCTECHASLTSDPATHIDGVWEADANNNMSGAQPRFLFGTRTALDYSEGAANSSTCWDNGVINVTTGLDYNAGASCHRDNGVWKRLWSSAADVDMSILANQDPGLPVCDVCHGQYASVKGWREGSVHYRSGNNAAEAKGSSHNKTGGNANKCKDCHAYYPGGVSNHENTILNFSGTGVATLPNYALTAGTSGLYCATCHNDNSDEVATDTGTHTFPATTIFGNPVYVGGPTLPEGSCTNCHGNTAVGNFWPDGTTGHTAAGQYESVANDINQAGAHAIHVLEIAKVFYATGSPSIAQQNLTCSYCHPGNTHGGLNGTLPADVSRTDSPNDGWPPDLETSTYMKKLIGGGLDNNPTLSGFWRRTPGTCSNVACHARGPYTPHWYGDTTKPNPVTTLAASAGTEPGSVTLTWTAIGDDADLDGIAYRLDVRTSATNITNETDFDNAIKAPGIPAVRRAGNLQTMVVRGLPMGALRYFAVRTIDRAGNASLMSNVVSRAANTDTVAPVFGGIDAAVVPTDASGTVLLDWTPAEDHTMPLSYKIWYGLDGTINYLPAGGNVTTTGTSLKLEGLNTNGDVYEFAVRACDANGLCDTNTFKKQAIPQVAATLGTAPKLYYANGAVASSVVAMNNTGYTATGTVALTTGGTVFVYGTQYPYPVNIYGDSFTIYLANGNGVGTATASLGSVDSAGTAASFVSLASSGQITLASKAKGIKSFKFNGAGGQVAATRKLAVKVVLGTGSVTAFWGSTANAGVLSLTDQFVNSAPSSPGIPVITGPNTGTAGVLGISWTLATDDTDGVSDTVHYDVFGSIDDGSTFPFVIAKDLAAATTNTTWNTIEEGLGVLAPLSNVVQIRVQAGDGYTHSVGTTTSRTLDNTTDVVAPAAASNFIAETRPKAGSVYLSWTAPGDDGVNNGRASSYDIRWSTSTITDGALWDGATPVDYEPYPDFGGETQHYEVLDLTPGTNYYFAIKASDGTNLSPLAATTIAEKGGPNCGGCHATPPSESGAVGNHERHGFTLNDCAKCHGNQALTFTPAHQDGEILYGYNNNVYKQNIDVDTIRIFYTADGSAGGTVLYEDNNGSGGFNPTGTGQIDSGSCMNWSALGISGCHGPAGTDPDGAGTEYPLYATPEWRDTATLTCSNCHGNSNRALDAYGRPFDGGTVDQIKSSPAIDNHGYTGEGADFTEPKGKYVGQHEKHLNYSFRLSKGDSCNLCHKGKYTTMGDLDGKHANGDIDIELDRNAAGIGASWLEGPDADTAGSCSGMSQVTCHPNESVKWSSTVSYDCIKCHFMNNVIPQHVTDPIMLITDDVSMTGDTTNTLEGGPMAGNCTWCHFAGHPQGAVTNSFVIPNNPLIGINYKSGGIHLRDNIGGRTAVTTEAQICWGCHYSQIPVISEWDADSGGTNTWTNPPTGNIYNYGTLTATPGGPGNWVGASWRSGTAAFTYKDGTIKSTHATGGTWTATVTTDRFRTSTEANDSVSDIRCSNCHDVHNLNRAPGDTSPYAAGNPYLRGTWLSNPYKEDGAPLSTLTYTSTAAFGPVPRGGTGYVETGGYYIDQNSGNPTATYSLTTSAGLCVLCHGINVNGMDKVSGENLWLGTGTNGHSNSAIGGTVAGADIFSYAWRNPTLAPPTYTASYTTGGNPNMAYQNAADYGGTTRADGFRATYSSSYGWPVLPGVSDTQNAHTNLDTPFDWGVTQNTGTVETGYHNFSCSKCHNPHASRLPKLMITNCLDTSHNTWDNTRPTGGLTGTSAAGTALATDNVGRTLSDVGSAQNCHRYVTKFTTTATNISFPAGGATIQSVTAIFTAANKYHVNDRIRITGGVNAGKVGTIFNMTTTQLTLTDINDASGATTTLTQATAGPSITLTGARGGWNKITPW